MHGHKTSRISARAKASGLKHYPTVLRTLKKLREKRLVQVLREIGTRGETIYAPIPVGMLVSYVLNGEEKRIVEMVAKNSSLFRELYKIEKDDYWAFVAVGEILVDVYAKREPRSFNEAIRLVVGNAIVDYVTDGVWNREREAINWLLNLPKVKWVREIAIDVIENDRKRVREMMKDMDELKKGLIDQVGLNGVPK